LTFAEKYAEQFWVDLVVHNPFNAEVNISNLTVVFTGLSASSEWTPDLVDVDILDEIVLGSKETRTVNILGLFDHVQQANFLLDLIRYEYQFWQDNQ
jgi:hypothetical protein